MDLLSFPDVLHESIFVLLMVDPDGLLVMNLMLLFEMVLLGENDDGYNDLTTIAKVFHVVKSLQ